MAVAPGRLSVARNVSKPIVDEEVVWQERGLCRQSNPDLFFSPQTAETREERHAREAQAKAICARCPVRDACLQYALSTREPYGVWGGMTETERRRILERERRAG